MDDIFEERGKAFESKFKLDQETKFKVAARRNKKLGLWVAGKLGYAAAAAADYAREVVKADLEKPDESDVIGKVMADLAAAKVEVAEKEVRREMARLWARAYEEVTGEYPEGLEEAYEADLLARMK
ncbi:MAG: DUF1476 domain-containing protein [Proteobacteria bacterium]|nr:DUF1476 domain-containing protein [Pseudomonadota bacterium]